jgi:hypothetical protein
MPGISVPFEEHEDSPVESGNRTGEFKFVRMFVTNWADRWTFTRDLFTGGFVGLPMAFSPEFPTVFADTFDISRIANNPISESITNPATQMIRHIGKALITVNYSVMTFENGNLIEYEQQEAGEFVTVPSRGLMWSSDSVMLSPDINAAYPTSTTRHVITWSQVRTVPWATIAAMMNKVNSVAFTVPVTGQVFVPGTLLFAERNARISLTMSGLTTWKIGLTFLEKAQTQWSTTGDGPIGGSTVYGWNYQWREDTGLFDQPVNATTGAKTFQQADLRLIFTSSV